MKRILKFIGAIFAGAATCSAAAGLSGIVKDMSTSRPLPGAIVRSILQGATDTTDAQGRFSLDLSAVANRRPPLRTPAYVPGQGIAFGQSRAGAVEVEILDFAGRTVATVHRGELQEGSWVVPLGGLPDGVYLCRITNATGVSSFRFITAGNARGASGWQAPTARPLAARQLAAGDRIITTCAGFVPDTLVWNGLSDSIHIRLTPMSTSGRTTLSFDPGWLFFKGDAPGAEQVSFADGTWRKVDVPFDWSIEGPYDQKASTGDYGGYLPAGIGWFRKHFTLPSEMASKRVFVEFDGVMANSSVYLNGKLLGTRPNGYVTFRYELTGSANFGATENILSVKADNSVQMASRWYAGAGIYRHVRLIAMDPVHFDKWATFVTTPTTASAHVSTKVVNQGPAAASVAIQARLVDPSNVRSELVTTPAKTVPAGGSVDFVFDLPVVNAKLWSTESPNMYALEASVVTGAHVLDDETIPFGVRTIKYDAETGFFLNGKSLKMKGVCLHHDLGGLGAATPIRAWQRRLAVLKTLGVNAIRTSHNHFDPAVLDLMDRMGLLVMDEFFDVWVGHKYGMAGDYATYFKQWYKTDLEDIVKRDRNHPGIVIYSIGNEIRDALSTRLPYTKAMIEQCHALDPTRPVTQALFRPKDAGDYPQGTIDLFDVFGVNYRNTELLEAITGSTPRKSGISTEMGMNPSLWNSFYTKHPQVVGEFIWTGAEYLGEAEGSWPTVMGNDGAGTVLGLIDRTSEIKDIGYSFANVWSGNPPAKPKLSTAPVAKLALSVDHPVLATDFDDIAYVRATFVDANRNQVANATGPVTFHLSGTAGSIVAVDNGNPSSTESYRGNIRKAYNGACYAMVQMKVPGSVTLTATSGSLTSAPVTVTGTAGAFKPCAGSCD